MQITFALFAFSQIPCQQSRFDLSLMSRERASDSADIFKFL